MLAIKGFVVVALAGPMVAGVTGLMADPTPEPLPTPPTARGAVPEPSRLTEPMPEVEVPPPPASLVVIEEPTALEVLLLPEPEAELEPEEVVEPLHHTRRAFPHRGIPENLKPQRARGKPGGGDPLPVPSPGPTVLLGCGAFALAYRRR